MTAAVRVSEAVSYIVKVEGRGPAKRSGECALNEGKGRQCLVATAPLRPPNLLAIDGPAG